jgi:hypothetical protein
MAHRTVLSARQRTALFDLPTSEASLLQHYTLADDDIEHIRGRRRPENQIGFALQLCAFRYPGRLLKPGEVIPEVMSRFIAAQLGLKTDDLVFYATRENTRHEHLHSRDSGHSCTTQHRGLWARCRRSPHMHPFECTKNAMDGGCADGVDGSCINRRRNAP